MRRRTSRDGTLRVVLALAFVLAVVLIFGGWHFVAHKSDLRPALVTPQTDVHLEFSNGVIARFYRATHELPQDRSRRPKLIALTFDDGPHPIYTPLLLDVLHDLGVPATFFLIGRDAQTWPELARRIETNGNEVADHTYSHPNLALEPDATVRNEILEGRDVLWALTHDPGVRSLLRPPHGRFTDRTLRVAQSLRYSVVLWTDDSGDWRTVPTGAIERHVLLYATAPEIVLMHSGKLETIEAVPVIVAHFRNAGYRFVTVSELLRLVTPEELNHPLRRRV